MNITNKELKTLLWYTVAEKQLASDLLEARELIKEMREVLENDLRDCDKIDQVCAMAGVHPYSLMRKALTNILDKSKKYAE